MTQSRLVEEDYDPLYFYFREIQGGRLREWTLKEDAEVRPVLEVLEGLDQQTRSHSLEELDLNDNPKMFVKNLIKTYPDHIEDFCTSLVNNFSNNMLTRARQGGKYVILILLSDSVIICHTNSEEKTVTKDKKVIERLLDTDNVDKYARFQKTDEDEYSVSHFERHLSKSFSDWLGINPQEVAYEEAGDIKIFTKIDDSPARFEYEQEEFEQKFLIDENYRLVDDILETPQDRYPVKHIKMGRHRFDTVDEFMQEFHSLYYDLLNYQSQYETIAESVTPHVTSVIDHEDKVTKGGTNGETHVVKNHSDFDIVFADKSIKLSAQWRLELSKQFAQGERIRMTHAGNDFAETPVTIGPFEIYNDFDVDDEKLNELYAVTQEAGTGDNLSNIIYAVILHTLSQWAPSPVCHFFGRMTQLYEDELDAEGMILRDEDALMELKSRDWVVDADGNEKIAEKISKEIQSDARLLLIGVEEEEQRIRPVSRNKFDSERNGNIKDAVRRLNGHHDSIEMSALPLGDGECLLFVYSVRGDQSFDLAFT